MLTQPAPGAVPVLRIERLTKQYGAVLAVRELSLTVGAGEILGLVGPNGAGKTTTMRCVCGVIPPSAGTMSVCGVDVQSRPVEAKRQLAYVPDDPRLFDALTVEEHLEFTAAAYDVAGWRERAEELLQRFELTEKRKTLTMELSRGMRQKTAICCAYLHEPRLIFLDEPLTGLDPRGIRTMKDTIREAASRGVAVVVSSHLLALVEDLCTSLCILVKGEVRFAGAIAEARAAFGGAAGDASLEDVFFRAVEGAAVAPPVVPGPGGGS